MVSIEVADRTLGPSRVEAMAVALLLGSCLKIRWEADENGDPNMVASGRRAGPPPAKAMPKGLWQRPLGVEQPPEKDGLPTHHRGSFGERAPAGGCRPSRAARQARLGQLDLSAGAGAHRRPCRTCFSPPPCH